MMVARYFDIRLFVLLITTAISPASLAQTGVTLHENELGGARGFVGSSIDELYSVDGQASFIGDINADGLDDFAWHKGEVAGDRGYVHVRFGTRTQQRKHAPLSGGSLVGFSMRGLEDHEHIGNRLAPAGDVNGDGIDDFLVGSPRAHVNSYFEGRVYVIYGRTDGFPDLLDLESLDGTNGYRIEGLYGEFWLGEQVSSAGDLNNDGLDDIAISARRTTRQGWPPAYGTYVIFGSRNREPFFDITTLDGTNGFEITTSRTDPTWWADISNAAIGDFNGDGLTDFVAGNFNTHRPTAGHPPLSEVFIVFGGGNYPATFEMANAPEGLGTYIPIKRDYTLLGGNVDSVGDVNGDGLADLIIGVHNQRFTTPEARAEAAVVLGHANAQPTTTLSELREQSRLIDITDLTSPRRSTRTSGRGISVTGLGDFDRDGFDDFAVFEPRIWDFTGYLWVFFGSADLPRRVTTQYLGSVDGDNGFRISGGEIGIDLSRSSHRSVDAGGDFNGDGLPDILITNPGYSVVPHSNGALSLFMGSNRSDLPFANPSNGGADGNGDPDGNGVDVPDISADRALVAFQRFENSTLDESIYHNRVVSDGVSYERIATDIGINVKPDSTLFVPAVANINVRGDLSVATTFRVSTADAYSPVVAKYSNIRTSGKYVPSYGLELLPRGALRFSWTRQADKTTVQCTTPRRVLNGKRKNAVVVTRQRTTGWVSFWVNGTRVHRCRGNAGALSTGKRPLVAGWWSRGSYTAPVSNLHIGELRVYRRLMTGREIREFSN